MAKKENGIVDPTTQGIGGLSGLQGLNRRVEAGELYDVPTIRTAEDHLNYSKEQLGRAGRQEVGFDGVGESTYDTEIKSMTQLDNLANTRGELQPWYDQIGAGLAKGAILAGTTFVSGTAGLLFGGVRAFQEGDFSKIWDNELENSLQAINDWSEEVMPNYYTDKEREEPFQNNIFTANFLGDKFIKNLGFTVGAFWGGNLASIGIKATRIPKLIGKLTKSSVAPAVVTSGVGASISALNEGRIEALNNSNDWENKVKAPLQAAYENKLDNLELLQGTELYDIAKARLDEDYQASLDNISMNKAKMGNMTLMHNLPVLLASNVFQFGKLYANGYKTARKASSIGGGWGNYRSFKTKKGAAAMAVASGLTEGVEEISQSAGARVAGNYYEGKVLDFNRARRDPNAEEQTVDYIKAVATGINQTVNDNSAWEEFFIGSLTGMLGMPSIRRAKTKEGGYQSPLYFKEGAVGKYKEHMEAKRREEEIAEYMNTLNTPETIDRYQGLIRHNKYQNDMNEAAANGDEFNFRTAEHSQLVSDIAMFDNAGKLSDYNAFIDTAYDTSDENLQAIIDNTTSTTVNDKGKEVKVGPFIDKNGNQMIDTPQGKEQMIEALTKNKESMEKTIKDYVKAKNDIDIAVGQSLSDEQLEELTWMKVQRENWADRADVLSEELKPTIRKIKGNLDEMSRHFQGIVDEEGMKSTKDGAGITDKAKDAQEKVDNLKEQSDLLNHLLSSDSKILGAYITTNKELLESLDTSASNPFNKSIDPVEADSFHNKINDIPKLLDAYHSFDKKLEEYLKNPGILQDEIDNQKKEEIEELKTKDKEELGTSLNEAEDVQGFKDILDNSEADENIKNEVLDDLIKNGSKVAKDYKEVTTGSKGISDIIGSLDISDKEKQDALDLFDAHSKDSNSLDELFNTDSDALNDPTIFYDEDADYTQNLERFDKAQLNVFDAINQSKDLQKDKDKLSKDDVIPPGEVLDESTADDLVNQQDFEDTLYNDIADSNPDSVLDFDHNDAETIGEIGEDNKVKIFDQPIPPDSTDSQDNKDSKDSKDKKDKTDDKKDNNSKPNDKPIAPPVGDISDKDMKDINDDLGNTKDEETSLDTNENKQYQHYAPIITEFHRDAKKDKDFRPLPEVELEKSGRDYSNFYNYLESNGAFKYINDGHLKVGDTIGFMIDPAIDSKAILLIDKRNNQVVGSLPTNTSKYEGLKELQKRIYAEFNKGNTKSKFISKETTNVSKMMIGQIPYLKQERTFNENIEGVTSNIVLGVVRNGVLTTNGKIDDSKIVKPETLSNKEGMLFALIPDINGQYRPSVLRVKRFNEKEFNPKDVKTQESVYYKQIDEAITKFANARSAEEVSEAVADLSIYLYKGPIHIDFIESQGETAIVFAKAELDEKGREKYTEVDGVRKRIENKKFIRLDKSESPGSIAISDDSTGGFREPIVTRRPLEDVKKEILNTLLSFNQPLQVNAGMINNSGYNQSLLSSGVLTSDMMEAKVRGNWFATDYFDLEGNLQKANNPKKKLKPEGFKGSSVEGRSVTLGKKKYFVDLSTQSITNDKGKPAKLGPVNRQLVLDLAWADSNFGNITDNEFMIDNVILTPKGNVLNRTNKKYLNKKDSADFKKRLAKKNGLIKDAPSVVDNIYSNQSNVDKSKTDSKSYYVLEDDGKYHAYDRVHTRLGENWIPSKDAKELYDGIQAQLSKHSNNVKTYNGYLASLSNRFKIDLSEFKGKTDVKTRDKIVQTIKDKSFGTNAQRALDAGNAVDSIIRDFFHTGKTTKPDNLTESAYQDLLTSLNIIKKNLDRTGETFLTNNIVLFHKYSDGTRIAGEVDILAVDKNGQFKIYDVKTSKSSFSPFVNKYGDKVDYFNVKSDKQLMSTKDYYTKQLSAYKNLFESQYGIPVNTLAILPFWLRYSGENVDKIIGEKGILLNYDKTVNVPHEPPTTKGKKNENTVPNNSTNNRKPLNPTPPSSVNTTKLDDNSATNTSDTSTSTKTDVNNKPIDNTLQEETNEVSDKVVFDSSIESVNNTIVDNLEGSDEFKSGKVGYFELNGTVHKSNMYPLGTIGGSPMYITMTKETSGGFSGKDFFVSNKKYHLVFPNGKGVTFIPNSPSTYSPKLAVKGAIKFLKNNVGRIPTISAEPTSLTSRLQVDNAEVKPVILPTTPASTVTPTEGAKGTVSMEDKLKNIEDGALDEFEEPFSLREVTDETTEVWNRERELAWISKVLPQLSEGDRLRVVSGLIEAGSKGTLAWGQYKDGIITLSNIAAPGTLYHEAFHAVFQGLLNESQREVLLAEARQLYGNLDNVSLEENMSEAFREYTMSQETNGLGRRIINFFRNLLAKITHRNSMAPHLDNLYRDINKGKYAMEYSIDSIVEETSNKVTSFSSLTAEQQADLQAKGMSVEQWNNISQEEREQALYCL